MTVRIDDLNRVKVHMNMIYFASVRRNSHGISGASTLKSQLIAIRPLGRLGPVKGSERPVPCARPERSASTISAASALEASRLVPRNVRSR